MWQEAYGPIPKGYHIHHKDGNRRNNDLENLELIKGTEHGQLHGKQGGRPGKGIISCADCGEMKLHHAKGLCKTCYCRWRDTSRRAGILGRRIACAECGRKEIHHSNGRCERCAKRLQMRERRRTGVIGFHDFAFEVVRCVSCTG